jgi:uncharacterized membrane protein
MLKSSFFLMATAMKMAAAVMAAAMAAAIAAVGVTVAAAKVVAAMAERFPGRSRCPRRGCVPPVGSLQQPGP